MVWKSILTLSHQVCGDCLPNASTSRVYSWQLQVFLFSLFSLFFTCDAQFLMSLLILILLLILVSIPMLVLMLLLMVTQASSFCCVGALHIPNSTSTSNDADKG